MIKQPSKRPPRAPDVINKDGTLNIHRPYDPGKFFLDLHHYLLAVSWPKFLFILIAVFLIGNVSFAVLFYMLGPEAVAGIRTANAFERFVDCFFFSVWSLNGPFTPVNVWAKALVTIESYLGMLTLVIATGLFYARFARPTARVIFSENAIITTYNGRPCFTFRVANARLNRIIEARMIVTLTKNETSQEGESSRKFYNLELEFDYSPLFALTWTIRHFIDEESVLFGMTDEKMRDAKVVIFASLSGMDDTFSQTITARSVYRYDEIVYNRRFKDILVWEKNKIRINLKGINDMV